MTAPLASHTASAATAPRVAVVGHVSTYFLRERNPDRDHFVREMMLRITGSRFVPGSTVRVAVIDTAHWEVIAIGSTHAEPARTAVLCRQGRRTCYQSNARAGIIDYELRIISAPAASDLRVLYRSGEDEGMRAVTLR